MSLCPFLKIGLFFQISGHPDHYFSQSALSQIDHGFLSWDFVDKDPPPPGGLDTMIARWSYEILSKPSQVFIILIFSEAIDLEN
jgi:hypothetical protein